MNSPPWEPPAGVRAIFGGFLLAHSVSAANETVDSALKVHFMQASFLRTGNAREQILYQVERVADGRAFATRQVRAVQGGACIYMATIAYAAGDAVRGGRLDYGPPMPDMGGASPAPADRGLPAMKRAMLLQMGATEEFADHGLEDPFFWRPVPWRGVEPGEHPTDFSFRSFVRSPAMASGEAAVHAAALAFLTDEWLLTTPRLAFPGVVDAEKGEAMSTSSMNHSVHFHAPLARADEWMVCERKTSWAGNGRVMMEQKFWNAATGRIVLSSNQEGLIRFYKPNPNL